MKKEDQSKVQLVKELSKLRRRLAELESTVADVKLLEKELRIKEQRFSDIAKNALEWIWEVDTSGKYTYASPVVEKVIGYTQEEVLKKHFYDLFHPEEREKLKEAAFKRFARKTPFREFINRNVHKNGKTVWLSTSGVPILGKKGKLFGYRGADADITERKRVEEKIKVYSHAVNSAYDGIVLTDMEGRITYANESALKITGYAPDDIGKIGVTEWVSDPQVAMRILEAQREKGKWLGEITGMRKNREEFPCIISASLIKDENRNPVGTIGIFRDISVQIKSDEKLRFLSAAVEQSTEGIAMSDLKGNLIFVNKAFATMHGYTVEELQGKNLSVFHTPEQMPSVNAANEQIKKTGAFSGEIWHCRLDGTTFPAFMQNTLIMDTSGKAIRMMGTCRDISDLKEAEDSLHKSEQRFRTIFDQTKDAVFVETPDGRILDVNKATCDLLGYTREELLTMRVSDLVVPERAAKLPPVIQDESIRGGVYIETEELLKDGRRIPVEVSNTLVEMGGEKRVVAILRDISARKREELKLIQRTERINAQRAAILELSKEDLSNRDYALRRIAKIDAITLDIERVNIWLFNEERTEIVCLENYQRSEDTHEKGMRISVGQYPAYFRALEETRFIAADNAVTDSRTCELADEYLIQLGISSMMDAPIRLHGKTIGVVCHEHTGQMRQWAEDEMNFAGSIADMVSLALEASERKMAEEKLQHAQKLEAVGALAGGLAHDFNNILAGIMGYAGLLQKRLEDGSPLADDLQAIERLTRRGADLTESLLTFSRRGRYQPKPLKINGVVDEVLKLVRKTSAGAISVKEELSPDISNVYGDEGQLNQVIMNICLNAYQAMPNGGTLTVKTIDVKPGKEFFSVHPDLKKGRWVTVIVSDTGVGMDTETRTRIFEPFFTTRTGQSGTGLGLSIASGIMEKHGGCIEVESDVGKGTTFTVYLPATEEEASDVPAGPVETLRGDETILIIDDEADFIQTTGRWLRSHGYTVIEAASGEKALDILMEKKDAIDLVLLDMVMDGMSGIETFMEMRSKVPSLPFVICTGYSLDLHSSHALKQGCVGFIRKPSEPAEIALEIRKVLDRR